MNQTITSREELLLAKIAGHDVDLSTMTPGVASNLCEQFMLEIADRLDNMGGETYETVAEIEVGEMVEYGGGLYAFSDATSERPSLNEDVRYYLNSASVPSDRVFVDDENGQTILFFNATSSSQTPSRIDPDKPLYVVQWTEAGGLTLGSDVPDLSNTTVRILKAASEPSGGSNEFLVTADLVLDGGGQPGLDNLSATIEEIGAAVEAGKFVRLHARTASSVDWMAFDGYLGLYFDDGPFAVFTSGAMSGETPSIVFAIISEEEPSVFFIEIGNTPSQSPIPAYTTDEIGKVLGVVSDGYGGAMLAWVTKS